MRKIDLKNIKKSPLFNYIGSSRKKENRNFCLFSSDQFLLNSKKSPPQALAWKSQFEQI
jgi:hypothetical protein